MVNFLPEANGGNDELESKLAEPLETYMEKYRLAVYG
jgi:hypothetical protein